MLCNITTEKVFWVLLSTLNDHQKTILVYTVKTEGSSCHKKPHAVSYMSNSSHYTNLIRRLVPLTSGIHTVCTYMRTYLHIEHIY